MQQASLRFFFFFFFFFLLLLLHPKREMHFTVCTSFVLGVCLLYDANREGCLLFKVFISYPSKRVRQSGQGHAFSVRPEKIYAWKRLHVFCCVCEVSRLLDLITSHHQNPNILLSGIPLGVDAVVRRRPQVIL